MGRRIPLHHETQPAGAYTVEFKVGSQEFVREMNAGPSQLEFGRLFSGYSGKSVGGSNL